MARPVPANEGVKLAVEVLLRDDGDLVRLGSPNALFPVRHKLANTSEKAFHVVPKDKRISLVAEKELIHMVLQPRRGVLHNRQALRRSNLGHETAPIG